MKHPVHIKIRMLIKETDISRDLVAEKLDMTKRTLIRRLSDGNWTLPELEALEELFGVRLLAYGEKNGTAVTGGETSELAHTYSPQAPYKIHIEIDPERFKPQDFDEMKVKLHASWLREFHEGNEDDPQDVPQKPE